jgi:hypothetical protein
MISSTLGEDDGLTELFMPGPNVCDSSAVKSTVRIDFSNRGIYS